MNCPYHEFQRSPQLRTVCLALRSHTLFQNHYLLGRSSLGDVSAQNVQLTGASADSFLGHGY